MEVEDDKKSGEANICSRKMFFLFFSFLVRISKYYIKTTTKKNTFFLKETRKEIGSMCCFIIKEEMPMTNTSITFEQKSSEEKKYPDNLHKLMFYFAKMLA